MVRKYGNVNPWRYCVEARSAAARARSERFAARDPAAAAAARRARNAQVFDHLSIAALVDNRVLCVHGGLSPQIRTVDQIRTIERVQEIPVQGSFCDLMWSDPEDSTDTWRISPRGAGYVFGAKVATEFNRANGLELIARAHQLVMEEGERARGGRASARASLQSCRALRRRRASAGITSMIATSRRASRPITAIAGNIASMLKLDDGSTTSSQSSLVRTRLPGPPLVKWPVERGGEPARRTGKRGRLRRGAAERGGAVFLVTRAMYRSLKARSALVL